MNADRHVGARLPRSDGPAKVAGEFVYSSDLHAEGMLYGATVRSPHASALIRAMDTRAARALPGVRAVLTEEDVPGAQARRQHHRPTSRCSRSTVCATTASRWRSSPPTIR